MWKFWKKNNTTANIDELVHRYREAHDDLAADVFTTKGAELALKKEIFKEDGMGNWFCEINYRCRKDRKPLVFKITNGEYKALGR